MITNCKEAYLYKDNVSISLHQRQLLFYVSGVSKRKNLF